MATKKEIKENLELALQEIGTIKPWFDKDVNEWIFIHPNYDDLMNWFQNNPSAIELTRKTMHRHYAA